MTLGSLVWVGMALSSDLLVEEIKQDHLFPQILRLIFPSTFLSHHFIQSRNLLYIHLFLGPLSLLTRAVPSQTPAVLESRLTKAGGKPWM